MNDFSDFFNLLKIQIKKSKGDRWAVFSTFGEQFPKARNIILRDLIDQKKIIFFTHTLSKKVEEIKSNPNSSLCWYSKRHSVQLQLYGETRIANQDITNNYKAKVKNFRDYQGPKPGSELGTIIDKEVYFCVLEFTVSKVIALRLDQEKHRKFEFNLGKDITSKEIVP